MKWSDLPGAFLTGKDVSLLVDQQFLYVAGIVTFQNNNSKTVCTKYGTPNVCISPNS